MALLELMPKVIFMVCGVCVIGIILGLCTTDAIARKVAEFLTFLPTERFAKAPPAMGIPATKAMRGDLHGAVDSYEALLLEYPHEKEIYVRLLEVVLGPLKMEEYGENVLHRGLANLKKESERETLRLLCHAIRSGDYHPLQHLEPKPPLEVKILPPLFRRAES